MSENEKRADGGAAFPHQYEVTNHPNWSESSGMTLRDYFAAEAMNALIAKVPLHDRLGEHGIPAPTIEEIHRVRIDIAQSAFDYADAMLEERTKART